MRSHRVGRLLLAGLVLLGCGWAVRLAACPFCSAVSMTLSEEMGQSDVVVLAHMASDQAKTPSEIAAAISPLAAETSVKFVITDVLKGADVLGKKRDIEVLYFGSHPKGTTFLVFGVDPTDLQWSTPTALSERAVAYVKELPNLPATGAERLEFFQRYFEDADPLLAQDCYDEFAKAPYAEVMLLKKRMNHDQLVAFIQDPNVSVSHRRLYLTMLGVCGLPNDVSILEGMIRSEDNHMRSALDALVACYINLKGPDALPLVEDLFLKNDKAEYTHTYSAIMALRFHGQETDVIPKPRLAESMRHMLARPQLADLVIPDLARWQDWSVMDRLVTLFKSADEDSAWVRVPVIQYLRACPLPEAKTHLAELAKIDPDAVKRADAFFPFGAAKAATGDAPAEENNDAAGPESAPAGDDTDAKGAATAPATPRAERRVFIPPLRRDTVALADAVEAPEADKPIVAPSIGGEPSDVQQVAAPAAARGEITAADRERRWVVGSTLGVGGGILAVLVALFRGGPRE